MRVVSLRAITTADMGKRRYLTLLPETDEQVGYTLNLYPTCNKLLLNGRDIDRFMESHLPKIHEKCASPYKIPSLVV